MTGESFSRVKAQAVVADAQFNDGSFFVQIDLHLAGFGVFGNITLRFLADTVESDLDFGGQLEIPDNGDRYRDVDAA